MHIRPVDLPLLRDELRDTMSVGGHGERAFTRGAAAIGVADPIKMGKAKALVESNTLTQAELFYVTDGMCELASVARESMPVWTLQPDDVPSEHGFIYFDDLPALPSGFPKARIRAATWRPHLGSGGWPDGGLWINWYVERDSIKDYTYIPDGSPRLMLAFFTPAPFSVEQVETVGSLGSPISMTDPKSAEARLLATLKAVWLLMAQPIASVGEATYDRAARRRIERQGQEPPAVRVITLRRQAAQGGSGEGADREWRHRWVVRGHWRQQWLPSRGVHRPTWIAPHMKGPEGAPLLGGEKVYALRR
ncbi:hypothetical protein [Micromonospora sp. C41]|uniref:hypothetical protein n=1 Tax=Micromonospora sp. C41 TaxID=2824878 RepID=UPI001B37BF82|nr:hypothetical protein [Micromonospora sp. C41]MBQ1064484.1 hypothetical protein [Micromonospora sp. C41]